MQPEKNRNITIRKVLKEDFKEIALLHFKIVNDVMPKLVPSVCEFSNYPMQLTDAEKTIKEMIEDPDRDIIVACNENKIIGFLSIVTENFTDDLIPAPFSTIEYIEVEPDFQSVGIGQILIEEAERIAYSKGHKYINGLVWETNEKVKRLNEKNGFCTIERRMVKKLLK